MTTPFWCLFAIVLLPFILSFAGAYYRGKECGSTDNAHPRAQIAKLDGQGVAARAYAAQANAWEALAMFSAAVFVSHLAGVPASEASPWAIAFVVVRVLHAVCYIRGLATPRSIRKKLSMAARHRWTST